ncbi:bud site selection protein [Coemansia sp. RSA 988]|nr:bud site selection protein [Coemansia sp. RSA 988]
MAYNDCLQDVPDIFENEIGEALGMRTESLGMMRELGPPDLCHIVKIHSSNRNEADIGSYHHVLGVDTSSSASLAAYINSLQYSLNDKTGWFGSTNTWKIASGTYCTYNAFSKVDMRVQIKIPGGVDAYVITAQGERKEVSDTLWKECHVSAILRSILYADPATYSVTGLRRLTMVVEPREESRMVEALMDSFWNGWRLGSNAETQAASNAHNYLVDGLVSYFAGQGRFLDCATEILAPLAYAPLGGPQQQPQQNRASLDFKGIDPEVASLLAEAYMNGDEEVQAVRVMHQALKAKPSCYPMLSTQAEFLRRKKQFASARVVALMAVKYAPSEFHAWAELTEVYIDNGDFDNALLTLNTCPMYTYVDRDYPRVPTPRRINYPVKSDVLADYNLGDNFTNGNYGPVPSGPRSSADSDAPGAAEEITQNETSFILRLSAPTLKGTFAHAYKLLTAIASTTGWDDLLQLRSRVFVMEEEYRNSAMPSIAVDDEEDDDEDDHVPLSSLRDRKNTISAASPTEVTTSEARAVDDSMQNVSDTEPTDSAKGEDVLDSEKQGPMEEKQAEVQGKQDEAQGEHAEVQGENAEVQGEHAEIQGDQTEMQGKQTEAEEKVAEPEKQTESAAPPNQTKGKKKGKKGKGRKPKESAKAPLEDSSAEPVAQPADGVKLVPNDTNGSLEHGEANDSSMLALGSNMEDVSLSDDNNDKPTDPAKEGSDETAEQPAEESESQLAAPQTAAREAKEPKSRLPDDSEANQHDDASKHEEESTDKEQGGNAETSHVRKRLCERWLDNLIMILFDDLRTYTNWRTKMHNLRATGQQVMHQFTQAEWEALGDLALRLHRPSEAREAYEYALSIRFSAKAWLRLLEMYTGTYAAMQKEELRRHDGVIPFAPLASTDALMMALDAAVWLAVYNDRWYNNMAYPNPLCNHIVKLVNIHGLSKVRNSLISMNLKPAVFNLVKGYLEIAERFDVMGARW